MEHCYISEMTMQLFHSVKIICQKVKISNMDFKRNPFLSIQRGYSWIIMNFATTRNSFQPWHHWPLGPDGPWSGGCLVHCKMLSSTLASYLLDTSSMPPVVIIRNVSRHCQMSSGQERAESPRLPPVENQRN